MDENSIKEAIKTDPSLNDAFQKWAAEKGIEVTTLAIKEGWKAWEWCLRQLKERGMAEEEALMYRSIYLGKQARLGTYGAIALCLTDDTPTIILG